MLEPAARAVVDAPRPEPSDAPEHCVIAARVDQVAHQADPVLVITAEPDVLCDEGAAHADRSTGLACPSPRCATGAPCTSS